MPVREDRKDEWKKTIDINDDAYGGCCVKVAKRVMELLDEDDTPLHFGYHPDVHTPHGIICKADHDTNAGGITGFMAAMVAQMVTKFHTRGEEFRVAYNKSHGVDEEEAKGGIVNPAILTVELDDDE